MTESRPDQKPTAAATPSKPADNAGKPAQHTSSAPVNIDDIQYEPRETQISAIEQARTGSQVLAAIVPNAQRGDMLKTVPLLRSLTESERDKLGALMRERNYEPGEIVFKINDEPDGFYIILEGRARVSTSTSEEAKDTSATVFANLRKGDYFGETAIVNDDRRGATISADPETPLSTLYLDRKHFNMMFGADRIDVHFARRRVGVTSDVKDKDELKAVATVDESLRVKSPEVSAMLLEAFSKNALLSSMTNEQKTSVIEQMARQVVPANSKVVTQGEPGTNLFVIESGSVTVSKTTPEKPEGTVLVKLGPGTVFGELAILYNSPRAATVTTDSDTALWFVDRFTFRRVTRNVGETTIKRVTRFLQEVPLLQPLSEFEREKVAEALEEVSYTKGDVICSEGDEGDCMYFLVSGGCAAYKKSAQTDGGLIKEYKEPGAFFGELALKEGNEGRRQATVMCSEPNTWLLKLGRDAFKLLLGPLDQLLQKHSEKYTDSGMVEEVKVDRLSKKVPDWANLRALGVLGKGSYGSVLLVEDVNSKEQYALKSVWKQQIAETQQQAHIMSEKLVMQQLRHPFITMLHATYRSKDRLHFLMEPCLGGELFTLLRRKRLFPEEVAKFYAASVVLAFQYMHSKDTVYRDLKPENLMITGTGYIKVADFGFAKKVSGKTWTLCGTPDYLAPEIVASKGHGKGVDWWTLGVLIFEMLASYPPFYDEDQMKTYNKILDGPIRFPSHFSEAARAVISLFLERRPARRLGVGKGGHERILETKWFSTFNWEGLINFRLEPPIPAKSKTPAELKQDISLQPYPYVDDGTDWDVDFGPVVTDVLGDRSM